LGECLGGDQKDGEREGKDTKWGKSIEVHYIYT
jgi:hypothetical protein